VALNVLHSIAGFAGRIACRDQLVRGFGLLGLGELMIRLSRLVTAIALARHLAPVELGVAATAITCFELIRILANNGLGQSVIRAREEELQATCNTAWRLIWLVCAGMALLQLVAGAIIAHVAGNTALFGMIACLALVYLVMPPGMVQGWLLQRQQRMGTISGINTAQIGIDNLLTAGLAMIGFGAWAIVLPKLLTAPIWLFGVRRAISWRQNEAAGQAPVSDMLRYSGPILGSEILVAVRFNADKVLVGAILGMEALGIYYFAFNAGYGLSLVLTGALAAASFPHLADARLTPGELLARFDRALSRLALPICGLIVLQALAITVYVPVLFGERWTPYVAIVAVLCLSAVTKPCFDLACQLLRAAGAPGVELKASLVFSLLLLAGLAAALPQGLLAGVAAIAVVSTVLQAGFAVWARRHVARNLASAGQPGGLTRVMSQGNGPRPTHA
jgi:PST family polysaccharide transporter